MGIAENLRAIRSEISTCAKAAGRLAEEITLVAVSKTRPVADVKAAFEAGQLDFGENKVQELVEKQTAMPQVKWHMIGSLQRNKVKYIIPFIHLIHSIDSERLLAEVNHQAQAHGRNIDCLLQINISNEEQKGGFTVDEAETVLRQISIFPNVRILGLMGMAEFTEDEQTIRQQFRQLGAAKTRFIALQGPQIQMKELSMGMSGDFPIAIAEGSTIVRVGSSIFGSR